ncbi:MAG: hypothetical protein JJV98_03310 [Desulfosarcina sp.]|nr:hypothetical protein [Desulfobacterales bacterium]
MSVRAFFRELKSENPRFERAEKWMRYAGYGCLAAAVWNFGFGLFADRAVLPHFWNLGLGVLAAAGLAFVFSARALARTRLAGTWLGQLGIVLLLAVMTGFMYWMIIMPGGQMAAPAGGGDAPPSALKAFFGIFLAFVFFQFAFPGVMIMKYLERLKTAGRPGSSKPVADD